MSPIKFSVLALSSVALFGLGGCSYKTGSDITFHPTTLPHHEHPQQEWWNYQFIYHPHAQVYFEPYTRMFFWFEDGEWVEGKKLPAQFVINPDYSQVVYLKTPVPHAQHLTVVASAGPAYDIVGQSSWPGDSGPFALTQASTD